MESCDFRISYGGSQSSYATFNTQSLCFLRVLASSNSKKPGLSRPGRASRLSLAYDNFFLLDTTSLLTDGLALAHFILFILLCSLL